MSRESPLAGRDDRSGSGPTEAGSERSPPPASDGLVPESDSTGGHRRWRFLLARAAGEWSGPGPVAPAAEWRNGGTAARLALAAKVTHQGANGGRRRAEPWSDVAEGAMFEKDGTPRFVLAVESLRGFPKEALTRRIIQARDCAMRVDEDGALGHIGGRWCVGSQGRGRVDRSRIARNGPRNERRRRRLGSRCSDAQEGNRVSVRPERTPKSSEEHRERWRVVLVE